MGSIKEIENLLIAGVTVLWSASPDWSNAKPLTPFWRRKFVHLLWILGFAAVAAFLTYLGNLPGVDGLTYVVLAIVIVLIVVGLIPATLTFLDFKNAEKSHSSESYAITDRRLIILNPIEGIKDYFFANSIGYVTIKKNGLVHDLSIAYGYGDEDFKILRAISDAELVEKLIVEKFSIKTGEK